MSQYSCRVCLENESEMTWMFEEHTVEETVSGLYHFCTGLEVKSVKYSTFSVFPGLFCFQVSEDDNFPQYVCKNCLQKLEEASKIKKTSIDSHFMLKSLLEGNRKGPVAECKEVIDNWSTVKDEEMQIVDYIEEEPKNEMIEEYIQDESFEQFIEQEEKPEPIKTKTSRSQTAQSQNSCQPVLKTCDSCCISFDIIDDFKKHLEDIHFADGMYICEEPNCGKQLTKINDVYYHIKYHKNPVEQICHICGRSFTNPRKFSKHKTNHIKNVSMTCDHCGVSIIGKTNLFRHFKAKHLQVKYYCEFCPKSYSDKMVLKAHTIKCHDAEAKFQCGSCGQRFLFKSQLNSHKNKQKSCLSKPKVS